MTAHSNTRPMLLDDTVTTTPVLDPETVKFVQRVREGWKQGSGSSLINVLVEYPQILSARSIVIELAADEYRHLHSTDPGLKINDYCEQFSNLENALFRSICRQIEIEEYLLENPETAAETLEAHWPEIGQQIDSFLILEELGRGALARAYLCADVELGHRHVVVKFTKERCHEAATLGRLEHPHIMPVHSVVVEEDESLTCLCMPFLGRSTLHDVVSIAHAAGRPRRGASILAAACRWSSASDRTSALRGRFAAPCHGTYVDCVLRIGVSLADALVTAHQAGVFHGDIKPSNVLITPEGQPVLLDFNLSHDQLQPVALRGGTLPYMAPEKFELLLPVGDSSAPTDSLARAEVYSLGAVLCELLTGSVPYDPQAVRQGESPYLQRVLDQRRQPISAVYRQRDFDDDRLQTILNRCLAFDPHDRYESMSELRDALQRELNVRARFHRWRSHHRGLYRTMLASVVLLVGAFSVWAYQRPSYVERESRQGLINFEKQDWDQAIHNFNNVIERDPKNVRARRSRAILLTKQQEYATAASEFLDLAAELDENESRARAAYCLNLSGKEHSVALAIYESLVDQGVSDAAVHNNLGVSYQLGRDSRYSDVERLKLARRHLDIARQYEPNNDVVIMNILWLDTVRIGLPSDYDAEDDLRVATKLLYRYPNDSRVNRLCARLNAHAVSVGSIPLEKGVEFLQDAYARGFGPNTKELQVSPFWLPFAQHPQYEELLSAASHLPPAEPRIDLPIFINPFDTEPKDLASLVR